MSTATNSAPAGKPTNSAPAGKRQSPEQVKRIFLGTCTLTLKQWPSDGSHSIEISQKDHEANTYSNVHFPVHLTASVVSALSSLSALGLRRETDC